MIGPLIHHAQFAGIRHEVGHGILGQHGKAGGANKFGNAVVDFRVNVVRMSGEDNALTAGILKHAEGIFPCLAQVFLEALLLIHGQAEGTRHFC